MWVFASILCMLISIGIGIFIVSLLIDKSNNKGDSKGDFQHFSKFPLVVDDKEDNKTRKIPLR